MAKKISEAELHIKGKDKTKTAFNSVQGRLHRLKNSLISVKGAMGLLVGAGFVRMGNEALKSADSIGKFADRAGITTASLQKMRYAFDLAGVGVEAVDKAFLTFGKRLGKAHQGIGALAGGLKGGEEALLEKLKATDSTTEALQVMFEAMGAAETQTRKLAIADAAFGMAGLRMTAAFRDGSATFAEFQQQAVELGIVLDEKLIRSAEEMNDQMTTVSYVMKTKMMEVFIKLAPAVEAVANGLISIVDLASSLADPVRDSSLEINSFNTAIQQTKKQLEFLEAQHGTKILGIWTHDHADQIAFLTDKINTLTKARDKLLKPVAPDLAGTLTLSPKDGKRPPSGIETLMDKLDMGKLVDRELENALALKKAKEDKIKLFIKEKNFEIDLMGLRSRGHEEAAQQFEVYEELGIKVGDRYVLEMEQIDLLIAEQIKLNKQIEFQNRLVNMAENVFDRAGDGMLRALQKGEDAFESFKNVAMAALFDIGREMTKLMVFDPIKQAAKPFLGQLAGSIGSAIGGSMFGGSAGSSGGTDFDMQGFASGGFAHAGKPAIVGERGAELFMPRAGGQIIPNDQLGGGGVNITLNLSTGIQSTVRAEVMGMMPIISANVKSAVAEARQRGGAFSEAMGV